MRGYGALVLRECMTNLIENVRPDAGLLEWLYSKGYVTLPEKQIVRSKGYQMGQMAELIDVLSIKDDEAFEELITFLKRQGEQEYIVKTLEAAKARILQPGQDRMGSDGAGAGGGAPEVGLTYRSIQPITQILNDHSNSIVLERWNLVMHEFLTKADDIYKVNNLRKDEPLEAIRRTLEVWIASSGSGNATLTKLVAKLRMHGLELAADQLEQNRKKILH